MAFTLSQWVARSITIALQGGETEESVYQEAIDIAEAMAHAVMVEVCEDAARGEALLVTETVTIALANGTGVLPTKVLSEFLPTATVEDPSDATMANKMRYLPWRDFARPSISTYGYFTMRNQTEFDMTRPGTGYVPGAGYTGNISLTIPCVTDMPGSQTATITVNRKIEQLLVARLAERMKGPLDLLLKQAA